MGVLYKNLLDRFDAIPGFRSAGALRGCAD
jgi:hypothetical protein